MLGPYTARFGYNGLVKGTERIMNSGTTPAGTYSLPKAFGLRSDPGTALPYTHADGNDYWALDRKYPWTFNTYRSTASTASGRRRPSTSLTSRRSTATPLSSASTCPAPGIGPTEPGAGRSSCT